MASTYFTAVTTYGTAQLALAAAGGPAVELAVMAVGDGSGSPTTPTTGKTQLVNETYRAALNFVGVYESDPTQIIAELIIPASAGGWTMREAGIYDKHNKLFAIANTPPSYKPQITEGSSKTQVVRIVIRVSSSTNVVLTTNTAVVVATHDYVTTAVAKGNTAHGWGNHASAGYLKTYTDTKYTASTGLNLTGTAFSIKYGSTPGTAAQGNDARLSDAREWTASLASQSEAEAGTHTTARKWTAQRVKQAFTAFFNALTSPFTRTLLNRANAALVRNDLQLGNAATHSYGALANTIAQGNDPRFRLALGVEQTYIVYSRAQRDKRQTYTNSKDRSILALVTVKVASSRKMEAKVDGEIVGWSLETGNNAPENTLVFLVGSGAEYSITSTDTSTGNAVLNWAELS